MTIIFGSRDSFCIVFIRHHIKINSSNFQCLSNSFKKQREKGNRRKLSYDHIIDIPTVRTYLTIANRSGLSRSFRPYLSSLLGF